jgi:hypothetical protein
MSAFTPDEGTLYYVSSNVYFTRGGALDAMLTGEVTTQEKVRDRSYEDRVFRCVAADARCVVGDIVHGHSFGSPRLMLLRADYDFFPVGPEVAKALGLVDPPVAA